MPHSHPPRKSAPGAQDAQEAEEMEHADFAHSGDAGLEAACWAIQAASLAVRTAGQCMVCGNPSGSIKALNQAGRAIGAARDSLQGLMQ